MPQEFPSFKPQKFGKLPSNTRANNETRSQTWLEREAVKSGRLSESIRPVQVWYMNGETGWEIKEMANSLSPYQTAVAGFNNNLQDTERYIRFTGLNRGDFEHALTDAFGYAEYSSTIPDLVVLDRSGDQTDYARPKEETPLDYIYLKHYLEPIDKIRAAADTYFRHTLHNGLPDELFGRDDDIDQGLVDHVFPKPQFDTPEKITKQDALEYAFYALVDHEAYRALLPAVRHYVEEDDFTQIENFFTHELLQKLIVQMQEIDEDAIVDKYNFRVDDEEIEREIACQRQAAALCQEINLEDLRTYILSTVQHGVGLFREEFLHDEDWEKWTARVLQPVIASVSPNLSFQRHALEHGANAIPDTLPPPDLERLAMMAAKTKDDWHSMAPERTRRFKRQFYEQHQAELEERAIHTADTEQELGILRDILEQEQLTREEPLRILDVGSGTGRITIPLSEQYHLTGLDANQHFLDEATKQAEGKTAEFKKGDIISYKNTVRPETYDTVTYTWHSFLEAYGIGNNLETLTSAWLALRPGGTLIFDMPNRENDGMEDGWYEYNEETGPGYIAYLMDEDELRFTLKMAGFDQSTIEIREWTTTPTELYPEGMKKWTVVAHKPLETADEYYLVDRS